MLSRDRLELRYDTPSNEIIITLYSASVRTGAISEASSPLEFYQARCYDSLSLSVNKGADFAKRTGDRFYRRWKRKVERGSGDNTPRLRP
jgi:hypothetical protein